MCALAKNFITAVSKSPKTTNNDTKIKINLADKLLEVRGFGRPIPISLAKKMVKKYTDSYMQAEKIIEFIDSNEGGLFDIIKKDKSRKLQFDTLKAMMDPENHIVSGVFGKEVILQTIAQKNCEGIRYIVGTDDDDKMTVILVGVKETNNEKEEENFTTQIRKGIETTTRKSEALPFAKFFQDIEINAASKPNDPTVPEVHSASLTVRQLRQTIGIQQAELLKNNTEIASVEIETDVNQILFGEY